MRQATAIATMMLAAAACAGVAHAQDTRRAPSKTAAPQLTRYQVAAGTALLLTLRTPLDSSTAVVNDQVEAVLWSPVIQDGLELIPEGSVALGKVHEVVRASDKTPAGSITLAFTVIEHAATRSRAMLSTQKVVIAAPLPEPQRGRVKRRPKPVDAAMKAGMTLVAMTSEPLAVSIPR